VGVAILAGEGASPVQPYGEEARDRRRGVAKRDGIVRQNGAAAAGVTTGATAEEDGHPRPTRPWLNLLNGCLQNNSE
jgi:hypothetical protein